MYATHRGLNTAKQATSGDRKVKRDINQQFMIRYAPNLNQQYLTPPYI
jgi:hypothetical protein